VHVSQIKTGAVCLNKGIEGRFPVLKPDFEAQLRREQGTRCLNFRTLAVIGMDVRLVGGEPLYSTPPASSMSRSADSLTNIPA
jgi:hypothetical protein